jgi:hypothetical protein
MTPQELERLPIGALLKDTHDGECFIVQRNSPLVQKNPPPINWDGPRGLNSIEVSLVPSLHGLQGPPVVVNCYFWMRARTLQRIA